MTAAIELRPYQVEAVDRLRDAMRRHPRVCFQLPTGGGKTIVFGRIASGVVAKHRRALVLVHRRELVRRTIAKLASAWRAARAHAEIALAVDKANERAKRWQDKPAPDDLAEWVQALLEQDPAMAWDAALRRIVDGKS